ncbi:IclR family transcriptional regulator [Sciscionella sediminilitoris]|uniref:IclR family transcriptional regulator n=1 Tax=Sciscionella sediminilitoris TaxID=1445613 RepID=UPI00055F7A5F|nr:IclR family transcriptional regulator [Sciscionella sp. SE31]
MSQAADKVLVVLDHVAASGEPVSAMSVAGQLGLDKSTCSRLLALLVQRGWLVRDHRSRLFSIGPILARLGATAVLNNRFQSILLPLLTKLRDQTGETIGFNRRTGDHRVTVAGLESQEVIRRILPIGESFFLPYGPSGKAIMAFVDGPQRDALLATLDPPEADILAAQLISVARIGYFSSDVDHVPGASAVSVPVFDANGIFGSLTIAGPGQRWTAARRERATPALLAAGQALSQSMGYCENRYQQWRRAFDQSRQEAAV